MSKEISLTKIPNELLFSDTAANKIYTIVQQQNLPFLDGVNEDNRKASNFEFEYTDMLGTIKHYGYRLDSSMEGRMLLFPARLQHTVYPFYNCDEERISISGNLWYRIDDDLQLRDS